MADASSISNDQSIAVLLLSIDQELAAKILREFPDDQVDSITRAMRELSEMTGLSEKSIRDSIQSGSLGVIRVDGTALIPASFARAYASKNNPLEMARIDAPDELRAASPVVCDLPNRSRASR